jgi:hypothetical protein
MMKKQTLFGWIRISIIGLTFVLAAFLFVDCGGGGGGGGSSTGGTGGTGGTGDNNSTNDAATTYNVSLNGMADDIELKAGETTAITFIGETPGPSRTYDSITLNLQDILDSGAVRTMAKGQNGFLGLLSKISFIRKAAAAYQWDVSIRVGDTSDTDPLETVCEDGWLYGPYRLSGAEKPETSETETITADAGTVDLINFGEFAICILISSPIDMTLTIDEFSVDVTTCDEDPADFEGVWEGTYHCDSEGIGGCEDEGGPITLTVTQDGHRAKYTDGYASYSGTVCGNTFAFSGGAEGEYGYTEKGELTLNTDGTAHKVSSFVSTDGSCSGDCEDDLERQ